MHSASAENGTKERNRCITLLYSTDTPPSLNFEFCRRAPATELWWRSFVSARAFKRAGSLTPSPIPPLFHLVRSRLSRLLTSFFYFFFFFAPSAIRDQRSRKMFIRQPVSSSAENVWQSTSLMDAGLYCRIVLDFPGLNAVSLWFFFQRTSVLRGVSFYA